MSDIKAELCNIFDIYLEYAPLFLLLFRVKYPDLGEIASEVTYGQYGHDPNIDIREKLYDSYISLSDLIGKKTIHEFKHHGEIPYNLTRCYSNVFVLYYILFGEHFHGKKNVLRKISEDAFLNTDFLSTIPPNSFIITTVNNNVPFTDKGRYIDHIFSVIKLKKQDDPPIYHLIQSYYFKYCPLRFDYDEHRMKRLYESLRKMFYKRNETNTKYIKNIPPEGENMFNENDARIWNTFFNEDLKKHVDTLDKNTFRENHIPVKIEYRTMSPDICFEHLNKFICEIDEEMYILKAFFKPSETTLLKKSRSAKKKIEKMLGMLVGSKKKKKIINTLRKYKIIDTSDYYNYYPSYEKTIVPYNYPDYPKGAKARYGEDIKKKYNMYGKKNKYNYYIMRDTILNIIDHYEEMKNKINLKCKKDIPIFQRQSGYHVLSDHDLVNLDALDN